MTSHVRPTARRLAQLLVTLIAAFVLLPMGMANAQEGNYPPAGGTAETSDSSPQPGQEVTVRFCCFRAFSEVSLTLAPGGAGLGTFTADAQGAVIVPVTIPSDTAPGAYRIVASGVDLTGDPMTLETNITVEGAQAPAENNTNTGRLPNTGSSETVLLIAGLGAAAAAAGTVVVVRARKS